MNERTSRPEPPLFVVALLLTLLFATGVAADNTPSLFAIDKQTGERVGQIELPSLPRVQHSAREAMMAPALSASGVVRYDGVTSPSRVKVSNCRSSSISRSTILPSAIDVVPL